MVKIIALLLVMLLINAFMIIAILRAYKRVDELIRKYFLKKMGALGYIRNEVPVAVVEEEEVVKKESEEPVFEDLKQGNIVVSANPTYMVSSTIENADYKNMDFKEEYKTLKNEMDFNKEKLVSNIIDNASYDVNDILSKAAYSIKESLEYDTIYELSTLSPNDQLNVLRTVLNDEGTKLLDYFIENEQVGDFDALAFSNYVNQMAELYDPNFYVKTGWKSDNFDGLGNNVVTIHDDNICEGIKVVHKGKLFDYSI